MHSFKGGLAAPTFAVLAAIVGLLTGGSSQSTYASAAPATASSRPPVVTEPFKPVLPCDPNTTIGQEGCGERRLLSADTQLNADITVIFGLLHTTVARRDFVNAQAAWLAYRNADCKSQSDVYQGGTEQPVADVYCRAADVSSRRQDLKGFFHALTQDLGTKAPKFP